MEHQDGINIPVLANIDAGIILPDICRSLHPIFLLSRKFDAHDVALRGDDAGDEWSTG